MVVSIASDHAGYELRQKVRKYLEEKGFEVLDGGAPNGTDSYSYVLRLLKTLQAVRLKEASLSAVQVSESLLSATSTRESDALFAPTSSWLRCPDSITMHRSLHSVSV